MTNVPSNIDNWIKNIKALNSESITALKELQEKVFYPEPVNMFKAFKECPYEDLKVVILGQDPYHDGSATGLN